MKKWRNMPKKVERKPVEVPEELRYTIAIHEAGHAIVHVELFKNIEIEEISIGSDTEMGRYIRYGCRQPKFFTKEELFNLMVRNYAGKAAEEVILHQITAGAINDLQESSEIAYNMVTRYGMGDTLASQTSDKLYNSVLIESSMNQIENLCQKAYNKSKDIVTRYQFEIERLAELIAEKQRITKNEIEIFLSEYFKKT